MVAVTAKISQESTVEANKVLSDDANKRPKHADPKEEEDDQKKLQVIVGNTAVVAVSWQSGVGTVQTER